MKSVVDKVVCPTIQIENDDLVLRLPLSILEFVIKHHEQISTYNEETQSYGIIKITNLKKFTEEIIRQLKKEESNCGCTLFTTMLEDAILNAIEVGAPGLEIE